MQPLSRRLLPSYRLRPRIRYDEWKFQWNQ